jgi:hypothetical protein
MSTFCDSVTVHCAQRHDDVWKSGLVEVKSTHSKPRHYTMVNASFTLRLLYLSGKSHMYRLDRRLGAPQSQTGHNDIEEENPYPHWLLNPSHP